ncbi:hypothetical protein EV361DRAFT_871333 [Lentinula raphanica]|uniref:Uncharacterized protein n=1 Tax=Lentinula raphanica TaxID=153919 RepID=A0AA38P1J3_9AGAR|nr:hypothetical protein F5880DRAFT_1611259 [Lentinula raphanica]KAJ3834575.1 hypothetical protein F5878DRAFT_728126 [Lentinula raphanica]KAJ3967813.1 hypothetical protein EV361DRAFT_871333 [Lentinula raphanica]
MNAASAKFRAGVVAVQVLVLILVPLLFPFCYAIPTPPGHTQDTPEAAPVHHLMKHRPAGGEVHLFYLMPGSLEPPTSSGQSLNIHHYLEFPNYPPGSHFPPFGPPPAKPSTQEETRTEQLRNVLSEVMEMFLDYLYYIECEEVVTGRFKQQFGVLVQQGLHVDPARWYPLYHLKFGNEVYAKVTSVVRNQTNNQVLRTEKWLTTVRRSNGCENCKGQVLGARVRDAEDAAFPTLKSKNKWEKVKDFFKNLRPSWWFTQGSK